MRANLSIYHNCNEGEAWASAFMLYRHAQDCGVQAEMCELSSLGEERLRNGGYSVFILTHSGLRSLQKRMQAANLWLDRLIYSILVLGDPLGAHSAAGLDACLSEKGAVSVLDSLEVDFFKARVIADWEDCVLQLATDLQAS
ncbi:hypothetical protein QEH52_06710 [Coraliomargarita sp. SDUM461003]|uniref:Flavodoxin-like domain-containing protein n=2 Tax=Thalassobacterium maritimum TaxID=3041265 RepID=A0ABU1ASQ5_9BACT|nr:hypothetical protein [Coraliomargarita sp. SDUM461003]